MSAETLEVKTEKQRLREERDGLKAEIDKLQAAQPDEETLRLRAEVKRLKLERELIRQGRRYNPAEAQRAFDSYEALVREMERQRRRTRLVPHPYTRFDGSRVGPTPLGADVKTLINWIIRKLRGRRTRYTEPVSC